MAIDRWGDFGSGISWGTQPTATNPVSGGGGNLYTPPSKPKPSPAPNPGATIPGGETAPAVNKKKNFGSGKSVKSKFAQTAKATKSRMAPAQEIMTDYLKPSFENAYQAAENMGVSPSIYGQFAAAKRQQDANFNRMGMSQSGAAMAAGQQLNTQFADAVQRAQAEANQQRYGAFSDLANQAYGYGAGATGMWQNASEQFNQQAASRQQQRDAQRAAEQAGTGQLIGGIADLGLAVATGGASVPFQAATGGIGGMMGGGSGGMMGGIGNLWNQGKQAYGQYQWNQAGGPTYQAPTQVYNGEWGGLG